MKKLLALLFATLLCYSQTEATEKTTKITETVKHDPERISPLAQTITEFKYEYDSSDSEEEDSLQDFSDTDSTTSIEVWNHFSISNSVINGRNCLEIDGNSEKINSDIQNDKALREKINEFKGISQITVKNISSDCAEEFWSVLADAFTIFDFAHQIEQLTIIGCDLRDSTVIGSLINLLNVHPLNLILHNCKINELQIPKLRSNCNLFKIEK